MRLSNDDRCPLERDLQPGCKNCQECDYFVDKNEHNMVDCKLESLKWKIRYRIEDHCLREPVEVLAKRILQLIVAQDVLKEK